VRVGKLVTILFVCQRLFRNILFSNAKSVIYNVFT